MTTSPPTLCPACGYAFDAHTSLTSRRARPREGDISLCLSCGAVLSADDRGRMSREAVEAELAALDAEGRAMVTAAQEIIRSRGPLPHGGARI